MNTALNATHLRINTAETRYDVLAAEECGASSGAPVTLAVDYENNTEEWWDAVHAALRANTAPVTRAARDVLRAFERADEVTTTRVVAAEIRLWGETLPGWSDGPDHARDPFVVREG